MSEKETLSESLENYLKQIYLLQMDAGHAVRVTEISKMLVISKPSVNRAVGVLCEDGYLIHEHYGTIVLTEKGLRAAENIVETYSVLKRFLLEFLEVKEEIAEKEACGMEHSISKSTRKKLKKFMKIEKK